MKFGFGMGSSTLREMYVRTKPDQWVVKRGTSREAQLVFNVEYSYQGRHASTFRIDPTRGFLVTGSEAYDAQGHLVQRRTITVENLGSDLWFPTTMEEVSFKDDHEVQRRQYTTKSIKVNEPIPDSLFRIDSLGIPDNYFVIQRDGQGHDVGYVWRSGHLIPFENELGTVTLEKRLQQIATIDETKPAISGDTSNASQPKLNDQMPHSGNLGAAPIRLSPVWIAVTILGILTIIGAIMLKMAGRRQKRE
jgi:hypothetical protein